MRAGDIVVLRFSFSDLSGSKLRPAVLLADAGRDDFIACQITSNPDADPDSVQLTTASFLAGGLRVASFAHPGKLFTAHRSVVAKRVARVTDPVKNQIRDGVIAIRRRG